MSDKNVIIKNIINEVFSSGDMKSYLCEHVSELHKHQIIDMIAEASTISLQRKQELFDELAETENLRAEIAAEPNNAELIKKFSYEAYAEKTRKALNQLYEVSSSDIFLLNTYKWEYGYFNLKETIPFTSYQKALDYIRENYPDDYCDEYRVWHILGKWHTDKEGNITEKIWYIIAKGNVLYYAKSRCFDVYPGDNLNLPVPFKPGDILTVQDMPFAEKRYGIILEVGDNIDCCCVQILYIADDGLVEVNALKHGHILDIPLSVATSPLYSAEKCNDVYDEKSEVLLLIQRYMANMKCEPSTFRDKFYDKVIYSSDITEDFLDKLCEGSI